MTTRFYKSNYPKMFLLLFLYTFIAGTVAQTSLCPATYGDFPNPSSEACTTFFRCILGRPTMLRCPINQRFDFLFRICRPQAQIDCNRQLQVFTAPPAAGFGALNLGGLGGVLGGTGGNVGGALGGLTGTVGRLGAGLPNAGVLSLLASLGGDGGGGVGGDGVNSLTLLALNSLFNQQRSNQRPQQSFPGTATNRVFPFNTPVQPTLPLQPLPNFVSPRVDQSSLLSTSNGQTVFVVPGTHNGQSLQWTPPRDPSNLSQQLFITSGQGQLNRGQGLIQADERNQAVQSQVGNLRLSEENGIVDDDQEQR